jgi:hypothetical protein
MTHPFIEAYEAHQTEAREAYDLFVKYCGRKIGRVPGCDTVIRLAVRISQGRTVAEAAAREYVYRWSLAIKAPDQLNERGDASSVFGAPHALGM